MKRLFLVLIVLFCMNPVFAFYRIMTQENIDLVSDTYNLWTSGFELDGGFMTDDYGMVFDAAACSESKWYIMNRARNRNSTLMYYCVYAIVENEETHDKHYILLCVKEGIGETIKFMIPVVKRKYQ